MVSGWSKRTTVVAVRLNARQLEFLDAQRGGLTRSAWLRMLVLKEERGAPAAVSDTP